MVDCNKHTYLEDCGWCDLEDQYKEVQRLSGENERLASCYGEEVLKTQLERRENERQKRINATHLEEHQRLVAENERLKSYCRDYTEMTSITLNVPDKQREAFNAAVSTVQKRTQNGNKCRHMGDTRTEGGMTFCDECGAELL